VCSSDLRGVGAARNGRLFLERAPRFAYHAA
jgi:hypothetical protein